MVSCHPGGGLLRPAAFGLLVVPGCQLTVPGLPGDLRLGFTADDPQPGVFRAGPHIPQLPADVLGRPPGLGLVLVADQPQRAVRPVPQVRSVGWSECLPGLMP
jgi:hypothetical protein